MKYLEANNGCNVEHLQAKEGSGCLRRTKH